VRQGALTSGQVDLLLGLVEESIGDKLNSQGLGWDIDALQEFFDLRQALRDIRVSFPKQPKLPTKTKRSHRRGGGTTLTDSITSMAPQKQAVLAALMMAPEGVVMTADDLAKSAEVSRKSVSAYLSELVRDGYAYRVGYGKYSATKPEEIAMETNAPPVADE